MESPRREDVLGRWESEGGQVAGGPRDRGAAERALCPPSLPPDFEAQPAWAFPDRSGRFVYEFNRVYGPPDRLDRRGLVCQLDEGLSYWCVTWSEPGDTGGERPASRWMSYAQARELHGARLTFDRFSSLSEMREELPGLLHPRWHEGRPSTGAERGGAGPGPDLLA